MVSSQLLIMLSLSSQDTFMYVSILELRKKGEKTTASLSAVFRSQKRTKLLHISGTCPGDTKKMILKMTSHASSEW